MSVVNGMEDLSLFAILQREKQEKDALSARIADLEVENARMRKAAQDALSGIKRYKMVQDADPSYRAQMLVRPEGTYVRLIEAAVAVDIALDAQP